MDIQYARGSFGESWFFSLTIHKGKMVIECVYRNGVEDDRERTSYVTIDKFPSFLAGVETEGFKLVTT